LSSNSGVHATTTDGGFATAVGLVGIDMEKRRAIREAAIEQIELVRLASFFDWYNSWHWHRNGWTNKNKVQYTKKEWGVNWIGLLMLETRIVIDSNTTINQ
jgi:hypothetical protein